MGIFSLFSFLTPARMTWTSHGGKKEFSSHHLLPMMKKKKGGTSKYIGIHSTTTTKGKGGTCSGVERTPIKVMIVTSRRKID